MWTPFPQSDAWGKFQASLGKAVRRYELKDASGKMLATAQFVEEVRHGVSYWFAARGPVIAEGADPLAVMQEIVSDLPRVSWPKRSLWWRMEPTLPYGSVLPSTIINARSLSPASTILVDLTQSEEELLAQMHQKTRYNIRLAMKQGVTVREGESAQDLDAFFALLKETASRDRFQSHPEKYLRKMDDVLKNGRMSRVRLAEKDGRVLAAHLEIWFGDTVTYLHGASSSQERTAMAPYALHWETMRAAKAAGVRFYDLWGCNPEDVTSPFYKPSWEGITRFKVGFGGRRVDLIGTWDLPRYPRLHRLISPPRTPRRSTSRPVSED